MKKLYRIFLLLIICIIIPIATASCRTAAPLTAKDEIVLHKWSVVDSLGKEQGIVSFNDGKININAKVSDENFKFSDECIIDDNSITMNSKDYGVIIIGYKMSGEKLELDYFGKKITLKKK